MTTRRSHALDGNSHWLSTESVQVRSPSGNPGDPKGRHRPRPWPAWCCLICGSVLALVTIPHCRMNDSPQDGSESHFLERCASECGDELSCLCGLCTEACTGNGECKGLGVNAECVSIKNQTSSDGSGTCRLGATCDVRCTASSDCSALGEAYQCESGFCRSNHFVCPKGTLEPGDKKLQVLVGDTERTYVVHVPAGYAGTKPVPLVLDFHPMGMLGALEWEKDNSGYQAISDREGFLVAWPQGTENAWNVGPCCTVSKDVDDFAFARAVVREISTQACVDPRRVHAVGFSMGGAMAYYLGCTASDVFASVAANSMDLFVDSELPCEPQRPVAEISFRDMRDTLVPYDGGTSSPPGHPEMTATLRGAVGTFQQWAQLDRCEEPPSEPDALGCRTYSQCQDGVEVTLCTSGGTGVEEGGLVTRDADIAWSMFSRQPMP